ncbi:MAG: FixH family protein [Paracoccaceae bacterium]
MSTPKPEREFTGRHALMLFVGAFSIIIIVNLALAYNAVRTFPGLEVKNSYVASQNFDKKRDAQQALGWQVSAKATGGLVILDIRDATGTPIKVAKLEATLGRATHVRDDVSPAFQFDGRSYVAPLELRDGNWNIRMKAIAHDGTPFEQRVILEVK